MYAVIETGGKQVRCQAGDIIQVEKIEGEVGSKVVFDKVLFASKPTGDQSEVIIGKPFIATATVAAEVIAQGRGDKIRIIKMKRRKQYRRTQGHRQFQTQLLVTAVDAGAGKTTTLSDVEKKAKLATFFTTLKPKGPKRSTKILGSRKRLAEKAKAAGTTEAKPAAKTAAKKAPAKTTKA